MDRITRKDLKTDHFVTTVGHTLEGLSQHGAQVKRYTVIGTIVLLAIVATVGFFRWRAAERQAALGEFFRLMETPVAASGTSAGRSFATEIEKEKAVSDGVDSLLAKHAGSNEAAVALYFRATDLVEKANLSKAIEDLDRAIQSGNSDTRALASFAKAGVLRSQGKRDDAETMLRALLANPGGLITKEQVTLSLAELIQESKPEEALKLLDPLRTQDGTVQRLAMKLYTDISNRKERASAH